VPLTVKDILEKTFKRSFKGYDEDEVDKFLDLIIDEFKALQSELETVKDELAKTRESYERIKHSEETIMNTLVSAQKTSEHMIGEAKRRAEMIISSAEATARQKAEQTMRDLEEAKERIEELKGCAQGFAASFANMINTQAAYFEKTYKSYFGQEVSPLGGINTDALEKIDKDISRSLEDMGLSPKIDEEPQQTMPGKKTAQNADENRAGYMELFEINKRLSDMENDGYPSAGYPEEQPKAKKYGDYSWLYENDEKDGEQDVTISDPKEKEELRSLIEEVIE